MSDTLLEGTPRPAADTGPEGTPLGEGRMVREDCWREVHRLFHVERRSKSAIARQLALDRKTVRGILHERAWQPFHTPKNLVMGLAIETAELMEHFLWIDNAASLAVIADPSKKGQIADELADVAVYLLNLSNVLDIDLSDAITAKMIKNAVKYPVRK